MRQRASAAVMAKVDEISWALSKDDGATTIMAGELAGVLYQTARDQDHTGTTKIQLDKVGQEAWGQLLDHKPEPPVWLATLALGRGVLTAPAAARGTQMAFWDPQAGQGSGGGGRPQGLYHSLSSKSYASGDDMAAGGILLPWNPGDPRGPLLVPSGAAHAAGMLPHDPRACRPRHLVQCMACAPMMCLSTPPPKNIRPNTLADESWVHDPMLRLYAVHGAQERRYNVYEHLEVLVHPIRVHLTYSNAQVCVRARWGCAPSVRR